MSFTELAAHVGMTPRAIRHYFHIGLLPRPEFRSSRTRYGRDHVARLFAIRAMLADRLDLEAIRARLAQLSAAEIEAYSPAPPAAASPVAASTLPIVATPNGAEAPWQHVALFPGLAIHVRADASPAVRAIAQAFIAQCLGGPTEPPAGA